MDVLIKGMEMPHDCDSCKVSDILDCTLWKPMDIGEMHPECPLVEVPTPHGDLIDRDILEQELINGIKAGNFEEGYEHYANINNMDDCVECVRYADTVIEAEDGT
jgi:hypothetical protein